MRRLAAVAVLLLLSLNLSAQPVALPNQVRELRLGLVCYGGVSLAIYMYGNARELHHLSMASAAIECDAEKSVEACGAITPGRARDSLPVSARPYYDVLAENAIKEGVRTRVVIDIISGTSAGGINGIFLAKALVHNAPLENLRSLWFDTADIHRLATGRPWQLFAVLNILRGKAALGGDSWLRELHKALEDMDAELKNSDAPRLPTLLVPGQQLDLLVTSTDFYGSERTLEIGDPATTPDLRYDHVYNFRARRDEASGAVHAPDFEKPDNAALAFAARSSASFPVAFPAIKVDDVENLLHLNEKERIALANKIFSDRLAESRTDPDAARKLAANLYLVDGGVLNNYPFGIAYARVAKRTPKIQTLRKFLYLEPDPGEAAPEKDATAPKALQMFWQAKAVIPAAQPIAQDILAIGEHNRSVDRVLDIVRQDEQLARKEYARKDVQAALEDQDREAPSIARRVETVLRSRKPGYGQMALAAPRQLGGQERSEIQQMRSLIEKDAQGKVAVIEESYTRLRVQSVLEQFATVLNSQLCGMPEDYPGRQRALVYAVIMEWAKQSHLTGEDVHPAERAAFLAAFDIGYHRRKLRFVDDWLNAQYDDPDGYHLDRQMIQTAQAAVAAQIDELTALVRGTNLEDFGLKELRDAKTVVCAAPEGLANKQAEELLRTQKQPLDALAAAMEKVLSTKVDKVLAKLYEDFIQETSKWENPEASRAVLARYLGFPYWDRASYPYTAFSGLGDLTHVNIVRFSPKDTLAISENGAKKLSGVKLGHFGAFLDPDGRQTDYLWGRLDGAERVLGLLGVAKGDARLMKTIHEILEEEEASHVVKPKNLSYIKDCVNQHDKC